MRIKLSVLALFALLFTAVLIPASAQNAPAAVSDQIPVGQIGGATSAVVFDIDSGSLYFNVGPRLERVAVLNTAPLSPTLPAAFGGILPGIPLDIKVANNYLYVALGKGGVAVVDPTTLQTLSVQILPGTAVAAAVAVGPQRLYVAAGNDGIISYDLGADKKTLANAQPESLPSPVRRITDVEVRSIADRQYLFVAGNNFAVAVADRGGVMKFDITDSAALGPPLDTLQLDINALAVTDAFVFAAGDTALYALNIAKIGSSGGVSSTVALPFRGLRISLRPGNADAYVSTGIGSVDVVSISTPPGSAPLMAVIDSLFTNDFVLDAAPAEFPADSNTYLYLADSGSGLSIASAPQATPGTVNLNKPSYVLPKPGVASVVAGSYPQAFVYSIPSMQWTVTISNLNALNVVGSGLAPASTINAMTPYTNSLLVSGGPDGLLRYLINPGGDPIYTDTVATGGIVYDAAVAWPNAIVANGPNGLAVVDISDPIMMSLIVNVSSPSLGAFKRVAVQGNYAYIADDGGVIENNGTFRIYDLTDPTAPSAMGSVSQTGILDIKVSGNLAFLAVGSQGIRVVDITNAAAPVIINTDDYTGTTSAQSLAVYKNFLFVTIGDTGVQMLSFNPTTGQLSLITTIPTSGSAAQLAWVPGQLYVADDVGGLFIIQIGADVAISKTAPASAYAGQNFTYTLAVNNVGVAPATGIVVTDALPSNISFVAAPNCANVSGTVTCSAISLAAGASATFTIVVKSDVAGVYTNTATVASTTLDVETNNNSSSASTTVSAAADLSITKTDSPDPATIYQPLTYTLVVSNLGPSTATHVVMTDTLSANVQFVSTSVGGCTGASTVVCNLGSLSAGSAITIAVVVMPTASIITLNNSAVVASGVFDPNPANNVVGPVMTNVNMRLFLPLVRR